MEPQLKIYHVLAMQIITCHKQFLGMNQCRKNSRLSHVMKLSCFDLFILFDTCACRSGQQGSVTNGWSEYQYSIQDTPLFFPNMVWDGNLQY